MNRKMVFVVFAVMMVIAVSAACTAASSTASCAFVVGDGDVGSDTKVHKILYPGEQVVYDQSNEKVSYVPCNSRNYIINDGKVTNANGEKVGDRDVLITASTKTGVPIQIGARALWTLNQSESAMRLFYNVCFKYNCASSDDVGGSANFSTPGWNGMLAENFGPAMDAAARDAAIQVSDAIWERHDPEQYKILEDKMSEFFADKVRANLGYSEDLFCGSGNSSWSNPDEPGQGEFTCMPVRIIVDSVVRGQIQASENTEGALTINEQRLKNAEAIYGPNAQYWLAVQDTVLMCKGAGATCIFNIGNAPALPTTVP